MAPERWALQPSLVGAARRVVFWLWEDRSGSTNRCDGPFLRASTVILADSDSADLCVSEATSSLPLNLMG